jgi:hypothetical protein
VLDRQAPHVLVADGGFLLVGTTDLCVWTAEGACNGLPISVAFASPALIDLNRQNFLRFLQGSELLVMDKVRM